MARPTSVAVIAVTACGGSESATSDSARMADSVAVVRMLVEGRKNRATVHAPKGMAIADGTLWVADIDAVRGFNRRTGAPVATIDLRGQKATFLNDVAVGPDGAVYVTDTGILVTSWADSAVHIINPFPRFSDNKVEY